jgi:hypothetical protein
MTEEEAIDLGRLQGAQDLLTDGRKHRMTNYDNWYTFTYKAFTVKYKICIEKGLFYRVSFAHNDRKYEASISIGNKGYQNLILNARLSHKLHFDISDNIAKNQLAREQIISAHGTENDIAFHSQCVLFLFKIVDKIIQIYGKSFPDYCLYIRQQQENDPLDYTFESIFLLKACHLLIHSNFEYWTKTEDMEDVGSLWY